MADANNQDDTKSLREAYKTLMIGDTTNQQDYDIDNDEGNVNDIGDVDSVYDSRGDFDFDKNIFLRLKQNDPTITSTNIVLFTDEDVRCFNSIDWKEDGDCISNNTHLKKLCIILGPCVIEGGRNFFSSVHQNRSIEELEICSDQIDKEIGGFLIEGLCGHCSLVKLKIRQFNNMGSILYEALGKVLKHPKSKLKDLHLPNHGLNDDGYKILCSSLAGNGTIKSLCINGLSCYQITSIGWQALSTLLRHPNCTLTNLSLSSTKLNDEGVSILASALSGSSLKQLDLSSNYSISSAGWQTLLDHLPHTSIKSLHLGWNNIDDASLVSLASISTLKSLNLTDIKLRTPSGWRSFFNSLQTRGTRLVKLVLSQNINIGNESVVVALGSLLSNMVTLKILKMSSISRSYGHSNNIITPTGWQTLFRSLQDSNMSLERLEFDSNQICDEGILHLIRSVFNINSMKYLDLAHIHGVTAIGWRRALASYLQVANANLNLVSLNTDLVKLGIGSNIIDDEGMEILIRIVSRMSTLKCLNLNSNRRVSPAGWQDLSGYLRSPNFALRELHLRYNTINDDTVVAFASALAHNQTLERLSLDAPDDDDEVEPIYLITERGWKAVSTLLCNQTSILDTYNSNHSLQDLSYYFSGDTCDQYDDLVPYLDLNENKDKTEVARQKILQTHFSNNDTSMQMLLDMELEMMPSVIAWIGRSTPIGYWGGTTVSGLSLMYNLTRRLPDLFDSNTAIKKSSAAKRKRDI